MRKRNRNLGSMKPGAGWKRLAGAVYEHQNGTRIHLLGLIRLPGMQLVDLDIRRYSAEISYLLRVNGGNKKRAYMAFANQLTT